MEAETERRMRTEKRVIRLFFGFLATLFLCPALADDKASSGKPAPAPLPFSWRSTYAEALEAALRRSRPLLVYCPPVIASKEPAVMTFASKALGVPPLAEGVRVGPDEILEILERFKVREVPALLLVDRRENVLLRWEGQIPPNCWTALGGAIRRMSRKEDEDAKCLREARKLEASGDLEGAYRKAAPFLASPQTSPENLKEAEEVERSLLSALRLELLRSLAAEGLLSDSIIKAKLESLRSSTSHAAFRSSVEDEIRRLEQGTIGGRPTR